MPAGWTVCETRYAGALYFLGERDVQAVEANAKRWQADFIVVFQPRFTPIDEGWVDAGSRAVSEVDWGEVDDGFDWDRPHAGVSLHWWVLKTSARYPKSEIERRW